MNRVKAGAAEQDERATALDEREAAVQQREQAMQQKESRAACEDHCKAKGYDTAFLDLLDTSDPEAFKTAVKAVQSVTGNGYTVTTTTTGAKVDTPPMWLSQGKDKDAELKRAFGLNN